jgi:LysM repeat protein
MGSGKRVTEGRIRRVGAIALITLALAACQSRVASSNEDAYTPPPPLALVAFLDPSPDALPAELHQLEAVISAGATPNEAVVAMLLEPSFGATYIVQPGDSLSRIAASHGLTLSALEAANPQLGPLSGRDWKLIHPYERVMLPDGSAAGALLLATRAPAGPPRPMLVRPPQLSSSATDFQKAQYRHTLDSDNATNAARIASWQRAAQSAIQPWQRQVVRSLEAKGAAADPAATVPTPAIVAASVEAGMTTLQGLDGRRVLLLLGGGDSGPGQVSAQRLDGVNLVIANLTDSGASAAWSAAGARTGAASVSALDAALTQLQLPQVVNREG